MNATRQRRLELDAAAAPDAGEAPAVSLPERLARIYEAEFEFVWRNARRLGVPAANAQDVVQDVFIVVQRRLADFRGGPIRPWIFGILTRVVRDYKRSHRRKTARWVPLASEAAFGPEQRQHTPATLAERAERARFLEALLDELSEDQRTLIVLAELEQWTLRELSEYFGSNINTIYTRLRTAKLRLEKAFIRARSKRGGVP